MATKDEIVARNPETPDAALIAFLGHKNWHVRWEAAQNRGASDAVRLAAVATGDKDLVSAVGQLGDRLSPQVIEAVMVHPIRTGREQLANTTRDTA